MRRNFNRESPTNFKRSLVKGRRMGEEREEGGEVESAVIGVLVSLVSPPLTSVNSCAFPVVSASLMR